ncbi:hypothetical protein SPI_05884 [Niveomyces insectorum RCEF 264]|uniref:L-ornithine N(5)-monooxygenase [NAD(P)H] n=1 Tax=Niveomyces insectorum RCEF 264 TaxID=1081102 RepID=A0A167SJS4_9HYPO|nr:hypothetical protein SPI_05884 [Niveomyces insectorum RCEF 264]
MATNGQQHVNGAAHGPTPPPPPPPPPPVVPSIRSRLRPADPDAVQDLLCVGFGPASLAIAVALHDALAAGTLADPPRVLFVEKQAQFAWHAGMLLPGAKMQISFLKDLATLRDPRSPFTFLHYLHQHGRLVEFINLSTFLPARAEYEDYLRWCARAFADAVVYGREVVRVEADDGPGAAETTTAVTTFRVVARQHDGQTTHTYRARNVLLAYAHRVPSLLRDAGAPYRVAVVGAGQSAAEIFHSLHGLYPQARTYLVMRSAFLRPSDDSPFVNSIFNPAYIDALYPRPARARKSLLADARPTNYGVVRLELIEALYERMYHQRRVLGADERAWPHRILGGRRIVSVEPDPVAGGDGLRLVVAPDEEEEDGGAPATPSQSPPAAAVEELDVDLIIAATGYRRDTHVALLQGLWPLLPQKASSSSSAAAAAAAADAASTHSGDVDNSHEDDGDGLGTWEVVQSAEAAVVSSPCASQQQQPASTASPLSTHPGGDDSILRPAPSTAAATTTKILAVARDYHVEFAPGRVAPGSGIWLQGCCEGTHGLSDTLLSVLATRSGEIVASIFGAGQAAS